jgi:hypothetical protein
MRVSKIDSKEANKHRYNWAKSLEIPSFSGLAVMHLHGLSE